jgi:4-hydroxy-tetrahydrodipicolinate reductase
MTAASVSRPDQIRVLVSGYRGRMGVRIVEMVKASPDMVLAGTAGKGDDLTRALKDSNADVAVDFTVPGSALANTLRIIEAGVRPVVGTTGFTSEALAKVREAAAARRIGAVVAANFSLGSALLVRCAKEAARYLPKVEIIELHHDKKLDAPSGTARFTASEIAAVIGNRNSDAGDRSAARGLLECGVPVHSVRLPGLVAHQEVLFGGEGEVLTFRHDVTDRGAYLLGVALAIRKVGALDRLVLSLHELL